MSPTTVEESVLYIGITLLVILIVILGLIDGGFIRLRRRTWHMLNVLAGIILICAACACILGIAFHLNT